MSVKVNRSYDIARESVLLVSYRDRRAKRFRHGSAVLTGRHTAITALHVLEGSDISKIQIVSPFTRECSSIRKIYPLREIDLAIVEMKKPISTLTPKINLNPDIILPLPILRARFRDVNNQEEFFKSYMRRGFLKHQFHWSVLSGMMLCAQAQIKDKNLNSRYNDKTCYVAEMDTIDGDSGSGVFDLEGNLLTIHTAGLSLETGENYALGASIPDFIRIAENFDLTR